MHKILVAGLLTATVFAATAAQAETYTIEQSQSRCIAAYKQVYVPARVLVNTKGILVKAPSRAWNIGGDKWELVQNPAVYIQTTRVLDNAHYTLVPDSCP
jgi:hypothetical protein